MKRSTLEALDAILLEWAKQKVREAAKMYEAQEFTLGELRMEIDEIAATCKDLTDRLHRLDGDISP